MYAQRETIYDHHRYDASRSPEPKAHCSVVAHGSAGGRRSIDRQHHIPFAQIFDPGRAARGLDVPEDVRAQVLACSDLARLDAWLARAVTAASAAEVVRA